MKYSKPAVPFSQQIEKLKDRGLVFQDETRAEHTLSRISFYRLRAYTYPFQNNDDPNHPFLKNIDFETIIQLYKFDRKLRLLVFDAIEKIEIALRTQIIYHFALTYGSHWQTNPGLYRDTARFAKHLETLNKEVERSDETFIKHYKEKYSSPSQPPCWMSLEVASMGTLSKFFQNLKKSPEKEAISKSFGLPKFFILENWMFCFSSLRNICAHHGRLWNRRLTAIPKLPYHTTNLFLSKAEINIIYKNKLYATLCCVNYMLGEIDPNHHFKKKLKKLMIKCPLKQEKDMGFSKDWEQHVFWN